MAESKLERKLSGRIGACKVVLNSGTETKTWDTSYGFSVEESTCGKLLYKYNYDKKLTGTSEQGLVSERDLFSIMDELEVYPNKLSHKPASVAYLEALTGRKALCNRESLGTWELRSSEPGKRWSIMCTTIRLRDSSIKSTCEHNFEVRLSDIEDTVRTYQTLAEIEQLLTSYNYILNASGQSAA